VPSTGSGSTPGRCRAAPRPRGSRPARTERASSWPAALPGRAASLGSTTQRWPTRREPLTRCRGPGQDPGLAQSLGGSIWPGRCA